MIKNIALFIVSACASLAFTQTEIYNEDFQTGLPVAYTLIDNDMNTVHTDVIDFADAWIELIDPENSLDTIMGSTSFFDPAGTADRWLITPAITLGAFGNILYWEAKSHDASYPDSYQVLVSITGTQIADFTDTLVYIGQEIADWTSRDINLSDFALDNQTVHIAFVNKTNDGFKLYIDDIRVEIEDPLGVNEIANKNYTVYPNPTNGNVNLSFNSEMITVYSLIGKELVTGSGNSIDLSSLEFGKYIIQYEAEGKVYTSTVVKL